MTVDQLDRALCEKSLTEFIRRAWPIIEPGVAYLHNWHIDAIAEHLEAVTAGQIRRLVINMPPRYAKSICVSIMWPCWEWARNPAERWIFASYASGLAVDHSNFRRDIITSEWYQANWGDRVRLAKALETQFRNTAQGVMVATSISGTLTGKGGNRLVCDDPHDPRRALSDLEREAAVRFFGQTFSTRLNDKKSGAIVVVMQRLHEKDISAHALEQGYHHLCLQAEAEGRTVISLPGGRKIERAPGALLWPEREGPAEIARAKVALGPYGYAGQYQQRPAPAGGGRFKSAWYRYFKREGGFYVLFPPGGGKKAVPVEECDHFGVMDPAGTDASQNSKACWTVIQAWAVTPDHDMLLVDQYREQVEAPAAAEAAVAFTRRHGLPWIAVEKDGIGLGVVQAIARRGTTVRPIKAKGSKEARSETAEIRMAAGKVYFPQGAPFLFDLQRELESFPKGDDADQVDAFAHAARWVHWQRGAPASEAQAAADTAHATQFIEQEQSRADALEAGRQARAELLPRDANPHAEGTPEHPAWAAGWDEAREEREESRRARPAPESDWVGFGDDD